MKSITESSPYSSITVGDQSSVSGQLLIAEGVLEHSKNLCALGDPIKVIAHQ